MTSRVHAACHAIVALAAWLALAAPAGAAALPELLSRAIAVELELRQIEFTFRFLRDETDVAAASGAPLRPAPGAMYTVLDAAAVVSETARERYRAALLADADMAAHVAAGHALAERASALQAALDEADAAMRGHSGRLDAVVRKVGAELQAIEAADAMVADAAQALATLAGELRDGRHPLQRDLQAGRQRYEQLAARHVELDGQRVAAHDEALTALQAWHAGERRRLAEVEADIDAARREHEALRLAVVAERDELAATIEAYNTALATAEAAPAGPDRDAELGRLAAERTGIDRARAGLNGSLAELALAADRVEVLRADGQRALERVRAEQLARTARLEARRADIEAERAARRAERDRAQAELAEAASATRRELEALASAARDLLARRRAALESRLDGAARDFHARAVRWLEDGEDAAFARWLNERADAHPALSSWRAELHAAAQARHGLREASGARERAVTGLDALGEQIGGHGRRRAVLAGRLADAWRRHRDARDAERGAVRALDTRWRAAAAAWSETAPALAERLRLARIRHELIALEFAALRAQVVPDGAPAPGSTEALRRRFDAELASAVLAVPPSWEAGAISLAVLDAPVGALPAAGAGWVDAHLGRRDDPASPAAGGSEPLVRALLSATLARQGALTEHADGLHLRLPGGVLILTADGRAGGSVGRRPQ